MALERIHLRKLLQLIDSDDRKRTALLRYDIRSDIRRNSGLPSSGGDFYAPFWSAARMHAKGQTNLLLEIPRMLAANLGRKRLYKALGEGFVEWWSTKRAWRNEPFTIFDDNIRGRVHFTELGLDVKIENMLCGKIGEDEFRIVYPYFYEEPSVSLDAARIGLFIFNRAFPTYPVDSFRILDVQRAISYSINDAPFRNNEENELTRIYNVIRRRHDQLRREYA